MSRKPRGVSEDMEVCLSLMADLDNLIAAGEEDSPDMADIRKRLEHFRRRLDAPEARIVDRVLRARRKSLKS